MKSDLLVQRLYLVCSWGNGFVLLILCVCVFENMTMFVYTYSYAYAFWFLFVCVYETKILLISVVWDLQ